MYNVFNARALFFVAILLVSCDNRQGVVPNSPNVDARAQDVPSFNLEQVGYFKSSVRDRVFTFRFSGNVDDGGLKLHSESLPYTSGQMTSAYYYKDGEVIPADGVTLAASIFEVNEVVDSPEMGVWSYVYIHYRNGNSELINCISMPDHNLCKR